MKKITFIIVLVVTFVGSAQNYRFGIKGGVNISNTRFSNNYLSLNTTSVVSPMVGIFIERKIKDKFYLETGLNFLKNGSKLNMSEGNESLNVQINITQINIPIQIKYELIENLKAKAGIYLGYILNGKFQQSTKSPFGNSETTINGDSIFKPLDFGFPVGVEYNYNNFMIELGYNFGVANILKNYTRTVSKEITKGNSYTIIEESIESIQGVMKNAGFKVSIGYKF